VVIKTIDKVYQGEYKSFQSRFIGFLVPTKTISEFKDHLSQLKKDHSKASHICYAYRIGYQNEEIRANDDGEPAGTAGKPILNQIYSSQLQNVSLFVVRYYGGTKLGVPGLIEAYKEASIACLQKAISIESEEEKTLAVELTMDQYYETIKLLKYNKINIANSSFINDIVTLELHIPISKIDFINSLINSH
jgi:uncharacterized YigZ family protein